MICLHIFATEGVISLGLLKSKFLEAGIDGLTGNLIPKVGFLRRVDNRLERVEIKILLRGQEWDVGFLNSTGDEKRLLPVRLLL